MISIAMTTYNGSSFLKKQITSIINQTYSDFEIIVSDDCSSDNTYQILQEFQKIDKRLKIFKNDKNLGFKKNFERAISLCIGNYIALADHDDIWLPEHLEVLLRNIRDFSASSGNARIINENDIPSNDLLSVRDKYFIDGDNQAKLYRILFYGNPFQGASSLYKRELFTYALPIPHEIEYHDAWFSACACCLNGLVYTKEPITLYRIHSDNASGNHKVTLLKQLIATLRRKGYMTDRDVFCVELKNRFKTLSKESDFVISEASKYHNYRNTGNKFNAIKMMIKYYKSIYSVSSNKQMILRCIGIIVKG